MTTTLPTIFSILLESNKRSTQQYEEAEGNIWQSKASFVQVETNYDFDLLPNMLLALANSA